MSRRHTAKFENGHLPPQPPAEARKQAKVAAEAESTAAASSPWNALLTTSSSLLEFIGDLTSDEEIAEQCAQGIVSLTSTSTSSTTSNNERRDIVEMICSKLFTCCNINLPLHENKDGNEKEEKRNERWTRTVDLLSAQVNAAFAVCDETLIELATIEDQQSEEYGLIFAFYFMLVGILNHNVLLGVTMDEERGWSYFDVFSVRFFTSVILVTAEKRRYLLGEVLNNVFNHAAQNPLLGQYLRRDTNASVACVTLLVDWLWSSSTQSSFDYCQAESAGEEVTADQSSFLTDMKTALEILIFGTVDYENSSESPIVMNLIKRAQETIELVLESSASESSSNSSSTTSSLTLNSSDVLLSTSLEIFDVIQSVRNVEMKRMRVAQISSDEIAITLPLILRVINSPFSLSSRLCSRPNRIAISCLQTFTRVTLARDELVRLDYLKPILDTIVPLLLKQVDKVDVKYQPSIGITFDQLIQSDESVLRLASFPHEYIEISSPKNLLRALFQFVQSEMANSQVADQVKSIKLLTAWCDLLIRAQGVEACDYVEEKKPIEQEQQEEKDGQEEKTQIEQDQKTAREERKKVCEEYQARLHANIAAGASEYMTIELLREMYDYFFFFQLANPPDADIGDLESVESFELRTAAVVLCARLLIDPITPIEFIEEKITQLSLRMIDDLMRNPFYIAGLNSAFTFYAEYDDSIFTCRRAVHASLEILAGLTFNRPPEYVEAQVALILGIIDSDYDALPIGEVAEEITRVKLMIDQERTTSLFCLKRMIGDWKKEELGDIPMRVTVAILANHQSYLVKSQEQAMEIVSAMMINVDLRPGINEDIEPERGIQRSLSVELSTFLMSVRQFLFDIILHTPNRTLAQLAFMNLCTMANLFGQVAITKGEVKLFASNRTTSDAPSHSASASASLATTSANISLSLSLPAEAAWQRVCSMFLTSRLPCQNTELRQECAKESTSYIHEEKLLPVPETLKEEDQEEIVDYCKEEEDEEPLRNAHLMDAFMDLIREIEYNLTPSHFLSSILVPILPALRRFHSRTWNHLIASTDFMQNMWHQLGEEMSPHRDSVIIILASCLMKLKERRPADVAHLVESIQKTASSILATKPELDLNTILPDEEMRTNFEQMINIAKQE